MARWTRFRKLFGLEPKADVDAEINFHVEMRIRELIEEGETPERAWQRALQGTDSESIPALLDSACLQYPEVFTGNWEQLRRKQRRDQRPLRVGQIAWIAQPRPLMLLAGDISPGHVILHRVRNRRRITTS